MGGWMSFIGNESNRSDPNPCELFRNNGDGTFTECAAQARLAVVKFVKAVASGDFNNDGRPDLFLSLKSAQYPLSERWPGWKRDKQMGVEVYGCHSRGWNNRIPRDFPTWFWDYNNDGLLDIMVTGYVIRDVSDVARDYLGFQAREKKPGSTKITEMEPSAM